MTTVIPDGFGLAAIELLSADGTQPFICTLGVALDSDEGSLTDQANLIFTGYASTWLPLTYEQLVLNRVTITVPAPGGGYGSVESDVPSIAGDQGGDGAALALAVIVNKRTSVLGRRGRGRMFIPGVLGNSDVDLSGNYSEAAQAIYQGAADDFDAFLKGGPDPALNTNPYLLHSDASLAPSQITSWVVGRKVGILRKRIR